MMQIKINGEWVDLYPNASMKYVFNNPAFSDKAVVGDFSYTLSFPDNDHNALILGFISNPDLYNQITEHECELYEDYNLIVTGIFRVTSTVKGDKISGNFINSAYDFINKIEGLTTKDLDLGGDIIFNSSTDMDVYIVQMYNGTYPNHKFASFPILNKTYKNDTPEEADWETKLYISPYSPRSGPEVFFPYLAYIIDQLFAYFNLQISNAIASHDELKKLCLIGLSVDKHPSFLGYNLQHHVLKVDLNKLLEAINSTLGTAFFFDQKTNKVDMVFKKSLLNPGNYVDWTDKVLGAPKKKFSYDDKGYELSHEFDSSDTTMSEMQIEDGVLDQVVISEPVLTPELLPVYTNMGIHSGEIRYVICEDAYWIIVDIDTEPTTDHQWTRLTWNFFGKKVGEAKNEQKSKLTTLGMSWHDKTVPNYNKGWMTPHSDQVLLKNPMSGTLALLQPGNDNYDLVAPVVNDFEPRVLFFRNMRPDSSGNNYPLGTSGRYDAQGNIIGDLSLRWDGEDGLYENFWKEWLNLDLNTPYEVPVNLNIIDILNLNPKKQIKIGSNFYLLKKLSIDFPIKKEATAEIVRV